MKEKQKSLSWKPSRSRLNSSNLASTTLNGSFLANQTKPAFAPNRKKPQIGDWIWIADDLFLWTPAIVLEMSQCGQPDDENVVLIVHTENGEERHLKMTVSQLQQQAVIGDYDKLTPGQNSLTNTRSSQRNSQQQQLKKDCHLASYAEFEDFRAFVHLLRTNFALDQMYCQVDQGILLAMNPFKTLLEFTPERMDFYQQEYKHQQRDGANNYLPPHPFETVNSCMYSMFKNEEDQTIVMMGCAGSGKSEMSKILIQYICRLGEEELNLSSKNSSSGPTMIVSIDQQILHSMCILDAFGNASSSENKNSSRFVKLVSLDFNENNVLFGASIRAQFLQKHRVVSSPKQSSGERNFHIFYLLLAGAQFDQGLKEALALDCSSQDFDYLWYEEEGKGLVNQERDMGLYSEAAFQDVMAAMAALRISQEERMGIMRIVASILHLGNVVFIPENPKESSTSPCYMKDPQRLQLVARLLEIDVDILDRYFRTRRTRVRGASASGMNNATSNRVASLKYVTVDQAKKARDGFSKNLYAILFNWLVSEINSKLGRMLERYQNSNIQVKTFSIHLLDPFGMEIRKEKHSDFDQLCMNYCAEKLYHYYFTHVFRQKTNNTNFDTSCISLFEMSPFGILPLLDEQSQVIRSSSSNNSNNTLEVDFVSKLQASHEGHSKLVRYPMNNSLLFGVRHFTATDSIVYYDASGFYRRNVDFVSSTSLSVLKSSKNSFVTSLGRSSDPSMSTSHNSPATNIFRASEQRHSDLSKSQIQQARGSRSSYSSNTRKETHTKQVSYQISALLEALETTKETFVCCLKPNDKSLPDAFDPELIQQQVLDQFQLSKVVVERREGFPVEMSLSYFYYRYRNLIGTKQGETKDKEEAEEKIKPTFQFLCQQLTALKVLVKGEWQIKAMPDSGKKYLCMQYSQRENLEKFRDAAVRKAAVRVQRFVRRRQFRWVKISSQYQLDTLEKRLASANGDRDKLGLLIPVIAGLKVPKAKESRRTQMLQLATTRLKQLEEEEYEASLCQQGMELLLDRTNDVAESSQAVSCVVLVSMFTEEAIKNPSEDCRDIIQSSQNVIKWKGKLWQYIHQSFEAEFPQDLLSNGLAELQQEKKKSYMIIDDEEEKMLVEEQLAINVLNNNHRRQEILESLSKSLSERNMLDLSSLLEDVANEMSDLFLEDNDENVVEEAIKVFVNLSEPPANVKEALEHALSLDNWHVLKSVLELAERHRMNHCNDVQVAKERLVKMIEAETKSHNGSASKSSATTLNRDQRTIALNKLEVMCLAQDVKGIDEALQLAKQVGIAEWNQQCTKAKKIKKQLQKRRQGVQTAWALFQQRKWLEMKDLLNIEEEIKDCLCFKLAEICERKKLDKVTAQNSIIMLLELERKSGGFGGNITKRLDELTVALESVFKNGLCEKEGEITMEILSELYSCFIRRLKQAQTIADLKLVVWFMAIRMEKELEVRRPLLIILQSFIVAVEEIIQKARGIVEIEIPTQEKDNDENSEDDLQELVHQAKETLEELGKKVECREQLEELSAFDNPNLQLLQEKYQEALEIGLDSIVLKKAKDKLHFDSSKRLLDKPQQNFPSDSNISMIKVDFSSTPPLPSLVGKGKENNDMHFSMFENLDLSPLEKENVELRRARVSWQSHVITKPLLLSANNSSIYVHECILGYMRDRVMVYRSSLAQYILHVGLECPEMVDEIYMLILKQLSQNPKRGGVSRGWALLSMCVGLFRPSSTFTKYVLFFLNSFANISTIDNPNKMTARFYRRLQNYASYCVATLENLISQGSHGFILTMEEIEAYEHRPPLLMDIKLVDDTPIIDKLPVTPHLTFSNVVEICCDILALDLCGSAAKGLGLFVQISKKQELPQGLPTTVQSTVNHKEEEEIVMDLQRFEMKSYPACRRGFPGFSFLDFVCHDVETIDYYLKVTRADILEHGGMTKKESTLEEETQLGAVTHEEENLLIKRLIYLQAVDDFLHGKLPIIQQDAVARLACFSIAIDDAGQDENEDELENHVLEYIPYDWQTQFSQKEWAMELNEKRQDLQNSLRNGMKAQELETYYIEEVQKHRLFFCVFFNVNVLGNRQIYQAKGDFRHSLQSEFVIGINKDGFHLLVACDGNVLRSYEYTDLEFYGGTSKKYVLKVKDVEMGEVIHLHFTTALANELTDLITNFKYDSIDFLDDK